jgi:hypothetical protein
VLFRIHLRVIFHWVLAVAYRSRAPGLSVCPEPAPWQPDPVLFTTVPVTAASSLGLHTLSSFSVNYRSLDEIQVRCLLIVFEVSIDIP